MSHLVPFKEQKEFAEKKDEWIKTMGRLLLFPRDYGGPLLFGHHDWTDTQLKRVCGHLIEFVVHYKSRNSSNSIKPSTLKTYILGIKRAFRSEWGYDLKLLKGPIF